MRSRAIKATLLDFLYDLSPGEDIVVIDVFTNEGECLFKGHCLDVQAQVEKSDYKDMPVAGIGTGKNCVYLKYAYKSFNDYLVIYVNVIGLTEDINTDRASEQNDNPAESGTKATIEESASNYSGVAELYGHEDGICDNCGEEVSEDFVLTNSYGDQLCEDCWDEYINSEEGLVEYVIGLANTDYDITDFDENDLVNMAMSWNSHKSELALTPADILKIEADATAMGLNFHPTDPDGVELI